MSPDDFQYQLPPNLIAQSPLAERTASRLLCLGDSPGAYRDLHFSDLGRLLDPGDLLVVNETRVVPGRIFGNKPTGGKIEILLETDIESDLALVQIRSGRSPKPGAVLRLEGEASATVVERRGEFFLLRFDRPIMPMLEAHGHVPLPPYINRPDNAEDAERYQTVFASTPGAVAAPTAGLHFDAALLSDLEATGIQIGRLLLHVGAGTFQPVRQEQLRSGRLHAEFMEVSEELCRAVSETRSRGGRVVAVGTTVVRALETAVTSGLVRPYRGETDLFIQPGFRFKVVDAMITNFHLPGSSLLMLVCAFSGREPVFSAYSYAIERGYRFFSYGDAMFVTRRT